MKLMTYAEIKEIVVGLCPPNKISLLLDGIEDYYSIDTTVEEAMKLVLSVQGEERPDPKWSFIKLTLCKSGLSVAVVDESTMSAEDWGHETAAFDKGYRDELARIQGAQEQQTPLQRELGALAPGTSIFMELETPGDDYTPYEVAVTPAALQDLAQQVEAATSGCDVLELTRDASGVTRAAIVDSAA